jgi:hypothetical protein
MAAENPNDPTPYINMKNAGSSPQDVFVAAKNAGHKNYECVLLICGVFDISLDEARKISHNVHARQKSSVK